MYKEEAKTGGKCGINKTDKTVTDYCEDKDDRCASFLY